ncbi:MAG: tRNA 2-thiouridine(34) synthase MnmA [Spirochaetales bacterium]|nr:tRNA 2-thiouridine(34) synthase MnmA [Spirochaetales bacterium]
MITAVAMSGGVDSSAAAWLLQNDVALKKLYPDNKLIGVTHWWDELRLSSPDLQNRAESVCQRIGIPYHIFDVGSLFKTCVMDDFASCYVAGSTPNPCVRCNEKIRFNAFYSLCMDFILEKSSENAEDFHFCTGHYVRTEQRNGSLFLKKAVDSSKDQSYMLYRIPKEVLSHCIFPLGEYTKDRIKDIASEQGFFGKAIEESQDICFINDDYISFLRRHLSEKELVALDKPGEIFDMEGNYLGPSRGFLQYTIGQRKGLGLGNGPWYVASVDADQNRVTVGRKSQLGVQYFCIKDTNWFVVPPEVESGKTLECKVQVRYNSTEYPCRLKQTANGLFSVELSQSAIATPGQSAVFYDGDLVIGGGIICYG